MYNPQTRNTAEPLPPNGPMDQNLRSDILLLGFITLSLLLHLLFLYLLPEHALVPVQPEKQPVYIDLRPPQPLSRELDLPTQEEPEKPRETPAKRLGPSDQVVKKEIAPKGEDFDDRTPKATPPPKPQQPQTIVKPSNTAPQPLPRTEPAKPSKPEAEREPWRRPGSDGPAAPDKAPSTTPESPPTPARVAPSQEQLKRIDLMASAKSAAANVSDQWRRKYRAEVEEGDTVWLDTEKDMLISFFRRFRQNVEMVWDYPDVARELGQEGTCLIKVTVARDGSVKDVTLKESSGFPVLDYEAMQAIRLGSPYGPLPKAYLKDELNIMVFFTYEITRRHPRIY